MQIRIDNDMPWFLQEGAKDTIIKRKKELEVFLKCLSKETESILDKTYVTIAPDAINGMNQYENKKDQTAIINWWNDIATQISISQFFQSDRKVNGEFGNWRIWFSLG